MIQGIAGCIGGIMFPLRIFILSIAYTVRGMLTKPGRWGILSLTLPALAIPLNGYLVRIFRGADPAPAVEDWDSLISGGLRLTILEIFSGVIIGFSLYGGILLGQYIIVSSTGLLTGIDPLPRFYLTLLTMLLPPFIIGSFLPVIFIRTARSDNLRETTSICAVIGDIGRIGWIRYFLSNGLFFLIIVIPLMWLELLFFFLEIIGRDMEPVYVFGISILVRSIIIPPIAVFSARYMTLLYDSAGPEKVP